MECVITDPRVSLEQIAMTTEPRAFVERIPPNLGVAQDTVCRWREFRWLPAHQLGSSTKFKSSGLDESLRAMIANEGNDLQCGGLREHE